MRLTDLLFRHNHRTRAAILEDTYRLRAAQLRAEAIDPSNVRRRSLLFYAASECESLADMTAEAAEIERFRATQARAADRRRRLRGEARTHGGRAL